MRLRSMVVVIMLGSLRVATPHDREQFVGTWTLEAIEVRSEAGDWIPNQNRLGTSTSGYIIYDAAGNMAVQLMRRDRPRIGPEGWEPGISVEGWEQVAADKTKEAFVGYSAYFGTYEVNEAEGYVMHHRVGHIIPDLVGSDAKRFYILEGDTLTLMPNDDRRLRWKRLQ